MRHFWQRGAMLCERLRPVVSGHDATQVSDVRSSLSIYLLGED